MNDDALDEAVNVFCKTIEFKIKIFSELVPSNSILIGQYFESVVKSFIQSWIGYRQYLTGCFISKSIKELTTKDLQIDGLVYDPNAGPVVLKENDFVIVNPKYCTMAIEVKKRSEKFEKFEQRLQDVRTIFQTAQKQTAAVIGIVIINNRFDKLSEVEKHKWIDSQNDSHCPIYPLFKMKKNGKEIIYVPYRDVIREMIWNIYDKQYIFGKA